MQEKHPDETSRLTTPFELPGHNGSPTEHLLGRTGTPPDFNSTLYSWEGLEDICLENIVVAQLNQDVLKKNFEIIINALKKQNFQIGRLGKQTTLNDDLINELKERLDRQEAITRELSEKNQILEKEIKDLRSSNETLMEEIEKLKKKDSDQQKEIDDLKARVERLEERVLDLESKNEKLEEKSRVHDERLNDTQERLNNLESKLNELMGKISEIQSKYETFEEKVKLMESINNSDGGTGDLSGLISEIAELKNRFKNYATRDDFNSMKDDVDYLLKELKKLQERIETLSKEFYYLKNEDLPQRFLDIKKEIQNLYDLLRNLKAQHDSGLNNSNSNGNTANTEPSSLDINLINEFNDKLSNKVNCEDFDKLLNEIALLHERINGLSTSKPGSMTDINKTTMMPSKDSNTLKELVAKTSDLESLLKKLQKDFNEHVSNYSTFVKETGNKFKNLDEKKMDKFDLEDLMKKIAGLDADLRNLRDKMVSNEKLLASHDISINDILKELARMRKRKSSNATTSNINPEQITSLLEDLINKLRQELMKLIEDLNKRMGKKIEMEDLWKSEAAILEKIDEIISILAKKFCDKNETKKALIYMENRINQIFAMVFGDGNEKDNDALFAKKPLFWSCASCDKDLDKFQGKLGDYKNWGQFPPKNTSPERMGRFGTGYARMLDDRKTHLAKEREKIKSQMASSQKGTNYENFPDINTFKDQPKGSNIKMKSGK